MRAAYYSKTGSADVIQTGELPTPVPGAGQVLVKISYSAVNPIDLYIRSGMVAATLPDTFVPNADFAGKVTAIGSDVKRFKVGDQVWGSNQGMMNRQGTAAEYAAVHEDWVYPLPSGVKSEDAAAVALTGITAHLGLFQTAELKPGETVFVNGGTGGVGSMVVQMAKAHGCKVITTVGSEAKANLCRSWGTDLVLNYKTDDIAAKVKEFTGNQGANVWFETQREPSFEIILPLMKLRGRVVIIAGRASKPTLPFGAFYTKDLSIRGMAMFNASAAEQRVCAEDINRWLAACKLKAVIGKTYLLVETAEAHRFLEANTMHGAGTLVGKVVIHVQ
ncbi:MAG TPA: NADPH:quinone reductase [Gemmatales bacterium]|nr:NADPH:quinone reductase [Gemmatales bacterium]